MLWGTWTLARTSYQGLYDHGTLLSRLVNTAFRPAFTVLTFGYLASTVLQGELLKHAVLGASVLTLNWTTLGAALQTVGFEVGNGTLGMTLASPVSRVRFLASRGMLHIPNGLVAPVFAAVVGSLAFSLDPRGANYAGLAVSLVAVSLSLTALGLLLGIFSLVMREVWALLGVSSVVLYVLSGAIVPLDSLHPVAEGAASFIPARWGIQGLHESLDGEGFAGLAPHLIRELLVGAGYFLLAVGALRLYEGRTRRRGSVDLV